MFNSISSARDWLTNSGYLDMVKFSQIDIIAKELYQFADSQVDADLICIKYI